MIVFILAFTFSLYYFLTVDPGKMLYFKTSIWATINLIMMLSTIFMIFLIISAVCFLCMSNDDEDELEDVTSPNKYIKQEDEVDLE